MDDEGDGRHDGPVPEDPARGIVVFEPSIDRWRTIASRLGPAEVRRRLAQFLTSGAQALELTETRTGFLARVPRRRRPFVAEITLAEWEGGTQVHVSAPEAARAKPGDLDDLRLRVAAAIG
jgi:hypothetical protein